MNTERAERMLPMLREEWDNVVVLCSRYSEKDGTEQLRFVTGNAFANQKIMENMLNDMLFGMVGGQHGDSEDEEEDDEELFFSKEG